MKAAAASGPARPCTKLKFQHRLIAHHKGQCSSSAAPLVSLFSQRQRQLFAFARQPIFVVVVQFSSVQFANSPAQSSIVNCVIGLYATQTTNRKPQIANQTELLLECGQDSFSIVQDQNNNKPAKKRNGVIINNFPWLVSVAVRPPGQPLARAETFDHLNRRQLVCLSAYLPSLPGERVMLANSRCRCNQARGWINLPLPASEISAAARTASSRQVQCIKLTD